MQAGRRLILKGGAALALLTALPKALLAAAWPKKAFLSTERSQALKALLGTDETILSREISLKLPEIVDNGAVVPVTVTTSLQNVESISIVVQHNPRPLVATFEMMSRSLPEVSSRIKMAQTSRVMAVVKTDTGIYSMSKDVKVTIGGCA
jgi:sulfur-oxidizing protein SoxY